MFTITGYIVNMIQFWFEIICVSKNSHNTDMFSPKRIIEKTRKLFLWIRYLSLSYENFTKTIVYDFFRFSYQIIIFNQKFNCQYKFNINTSCIIWKYKKCYQMMRNCFYSLQIHSIHDVKLDCFVYLIKYVTWSLLLDSSFHFCIAYNFLKAFSTERLSLLLVSDLLLLLESFSSSDTSSRSEKNCFSDSSWKL